MPQKKAKKRGVKSSRRSVRSSGRSVSSSVSSPKEKGRGLRIALRNLTLFGIVFVVSILLYSTVTDEVLNEFFLMLSFLTGFIAVAFLIATLIFLFLRLLRNRRK